MRKLRKDPARRRGPASGMTQMSYTARCVTMLPDLIVMRRLQVMIRRSLVLCRREKVDRILAAVIVVA